MAKTNTFETGVHQQHSSSPKGTSVAGHDAKIEAKIKAEGRPDILGYKGAAKRTHKQVLSDLKDMPKPNLTKEEMLDVAAKHKDQIKGGLADKKKPSDFDIASLKEGSRVEREHTKDKSIAKEIAMDHLMEDKKYYKKLKEIEKKDMLEVAPDGKQEIVEGKEPLKKDPRKLKDKWKELKKGLNNLESIMDLAAASQPEEQPQPEEGEEDMDPEMLQEQDDSQPQDDESDDGDDSPGQQMDENSQPEMEDEEQSPEEDEEGELAENELPDEEGQDEEQEDEEGGGDEESEQKIIEALKNEGYSEPEIAYIVHGHHSPAYDESKEAKAHATYAMADVETDHAKRAGEAELETNKKSGEAELQAKQKQMELDHQHQSRMKDLEFQHAQMQSPDPETEKAHKKRMLDLEYENAKAQMPDGSDKEHQKRMMDVEYQNAMAGSPDPEMQKQMAQMDLEERKLQLEQRKAEMKMELEFKKKEHDLKLKLMEENMKQQAKNKAEHTKLSHEQKMKDAKAPKKKLKKSISIDGLSEDEEYEEENEQN